MRVKVDTLRDHSFYNRKNPFVRMHGVHRKLYQRGICPKCSNLTLTDTRSTDPIRKYQTCPVCGWHGPLGDTVTFAQALKEHTIMVGDQLYLR